MRRPARPSVKWLAVRSASRRFRSSAPDDKGRYASAEERHRAGFGDRHDGIRPVARRIAGCWIVDATIVAGSVRTVLVAGAWIVERATAVGIVDAIARWVVTVRAATMTIVRAVVLAAVRSLAVAVAALTVVRPTAIAGALIAASATVVRIAAGLPVALIAIVATSAGVARGTVSVIT